MLNNKIRCYRSICYVSPSFAILFFTFGGIYEKTNLTFNFLSIFLPALAQNKWELKKNDNGIEVYTRNPVSGNLKGLRVVCELDATKEQLINTLLDISGYDYWVYANRKAEVIKTVSLKKLIYYTETSLPWPLKDRDLIVELTIDNDNPVLVVQAKSLPDYLPKNSNYIRVPYSMAIWRITQTSPTKLKIDYIFSVDPGGSVPAWLVNSTMTIGPYNSFLKLRELLRKAKTQVRHSN